MIGPGDPTLLLAGERHVLGQAARKRVHEFAAGRLCARRAVAEFGLQDFPIGVCADRRPRWPEQLTGCITHTDGFSAAAVAERARFLAIGIDAERVGRVSSAIWSHVFVPSERNWLETRPDPERAPIATLIFSAKEAFYKCQYEITGQWLDFKDVTVELAGEYLGWGRFAVRPTRAVRHFDLVGGGARGTFTIVNDLVLTAMAIAAH